VVTDYQHKVLSDCSFGEQLDGAFFCIPKNAEIRYNGEKENAETGFDCRCMWHSFYQSNKICKKLEIITGRKKREMGTPFKNHSETGLLNVRFMTGRYVPSRAYQYYRVFVPLKQGMISYIDGKTYSLELLDIFIVRPGEVGKGGGTLREEEIDHSGKPCWALQIIFDDKFAKEMCSFCRIDPEIYYPASVHILRLGASGKSRLEYEIEQLYLIQKRQPEDFGTFLQLKLYQWLIELKNSSNQKIVTSDDGTHLLLSKKMSAVVTYIQENYDTPIRLKDIAGHCFWSECHLSHEFKRCFGITITEYILSLRLKLAKSLMRTGMQPTDVYLKCGFSEYSSFFRAFKKEYEISPKEYYKSYEL